MVQNMFMCQRPSPKAQKNDKNIKALGYYQESKKICGVRCFESKVLSVEKKLPSSASIPLMICASIPRDFLHMTMMQIVAFGNTDLKQHALFSLPFPFARISF